MISNKKDHISLFSGLLSDSHVYFGYRNFSKINVSEKLKITQNSLNWFLMFLRLEVSVKSNREN